MDSGWSGNGRAGPARKEICPQGREEDPKASGGWAGLARPHWALQTGVPEQAGRGAGCHPRAHRSGTGRGLAAGGAALCPSQREEALPAKPASHPAQLPACGGRQGPSGREGCGEEGSRSAGFQSRLNTPHPAPTDFLSPPPTLSLATPEPLPCGHSVERMRSVWSVTRWLGDFAALMERVANF